MNGWMDEWDGNMRWNGRDIVGGPVVEWWGILNNVLVRTDSRRPLKESESGRLLSVCLFA